jgi:hypothetical protein
VKPTTTRTLASRFVRFCLDEAEARGVWPRDLRLAFVEREFSDFGSKNLVNRLTNVYRRILYGRPGSHLEDELKVRVEFWMGLPENREFLAEIVLTR